MNVFLCARQVKVWNLDKRDSGSPLCTRIFPAIPGNKPTEVSCLSVHENLNFMTIGTIFNLCMLSSFLQLMYKTSYICLAISCLILLTQKNLVISVCSGFTDGSVVLTKGDITRDRHSKTLSLPEGNCPITGLAFRQACKITHLFVATLEKVQVYICFPVFVINIELTITLMLSCVNSVTHYR